MDKISKLFLNQVDVLQKTLEHLLEKRPLQEIKQSAPFAPMQDLSQLSSLKIGLPKEPAARIEMLFSRIGVYFDSALLFKNFSSTNDNQWKAIAGIDQGEYFPLKGAEISVPFRFPTMTLVEVHKVNSPEVFSHLQQIQVIQSARSQALIFKPHPDYIFLVTSILADPWLKPHVERIQKEILLLVVDPIDEE